MSTTHTFAGSCLCGSLKYDFASPALFAVNCHCKACQKSTGSAFTPVVGVDKSAFRISGTTAKAFASTGDSGKPIRRYFCTECGTAVYAESDASPQVVFLKIGTLDSELPVSPSVNVYCRDKVGWLGRINEIPSFDLLPERKKAG